MTQTSNRRPRAESCQRLSLTDLRPRVSPGAESYRLPDGTQLALRWAVCRGCFGGRGGRALLMTCPSCGRSCRVLWRPPAAGWGCWGCRPISAPSHRRSGSRTGKPKPPSWQRERIEAEQHRIAGLLGLARWPPDRILWTWRTLPLEHRRPDAPRLSARREQALLWRVCALETLRVADLLPGIGADLQALGRELPKWPNLNSQVAAARRVVAATGWAMRRTSRDPRTRRQRRPKSIAPQ